ncbi:ornithine aminotransferase [Ilyonectria destructans]|nr:ornithine aminotransferase [Ilyonectria destructans]
MSPYEAAVAVLNASAVPCYHRGAFIIMAQYICVLEVNVRDPEGRQYLDFLSAYSAVNQSHCHPKLVKALVDQASRLALSSRAFYNDVFPKWAEKAVETAIKVARKWAYKAAIALSTDTDSKDNYGPYLPNLGAISPSTDKAIRYNNIADLEEVLEAHGEETAAFICEPIQGEAGVVALCKKHKVQFICDEIQTGIGRTGRMGCSQWANIKPDIVTLGKAISGGLYPVSCVLSSKEIMLVVEPGTHGSTYGGNPLGCAVSIRALEAQRLGHAFREGIKALSSLIIKTVRGKGLLNATVINESAANGRTAWDLCLLLKSKGLMAKPTHGDIIRFAPPLVISEAELQNGLSIIAEAIKELPIVQKAESH